ncbi:acetyl esterase/lipase [Pullulanibacillus pueri]|uniref:Acetylesterase n=1 Tax=Pullulanibacillus pueri TaxID=1437324 RepID=A0A8J3EP05_9BACL|nr:alpha/beta hydrolase [Pullulanibacillus pueri]MBM7682978.1 acetyl esterase/lipase [Pullulanibacillus pueri]GGH85973.1 acetylesterase [Pullulanibacillus pueri]
MAIQLWDEKVPYLRADATERPTMIPYLIDSEHPTSAIVIFPGGGYGMRADHEGEPIAEWLNQLGMSAFVVNYRVAPNQHPAPLLDAQRAVRYVRAYAREWNLNIDRIGILGFSAGGHLASTLGTHFDLGNKEASDLIETMSCRPDLMILCYPVITMQGVYAHEGSVINLLGEHPSEDLTEHLSNQLHVTEETPPTFLWHTADDASVPVENSFLFASALRKNKVPFDLHVYEKGAHGLGLANDDPHVSSWQEQCKLWLEKYNFA